MDNQWLINYELIIIVLLTFSLLANFFIFFIKISQKNKKNNILKARDDSVESYLEDQSRKSKAFYKSDCDNNDIFVEQKVLALRMAYMNIERKAYAKLKNKKEYWEILNERLLKLLNIFLPKLFIREEKVKALENRIALFKDRLSKISNLDEKRYSELFIKIMDKYHLNLSDQETIDQVVDKLERVIIEDESIEGKRFFKELDRFDKNVKYGDKAIDDLLSALDSQHSYLDLSKNSMMNDSQFCENNESFVSKENYQEVIDLLDKIQQENDHLREVSESLREKWSGFVDRGKRSIHNATIMIHEGKSNFNQFSSELKDISDDALYFAESEVERLRDKMVLQESEIKELEKKSFKMENEISDKNSNIIK